MVGSDRLFDRLLPSALVGLALLGAYQQRPSLVSFALALLLTLLATRYWSRHCLDRVSYERHTSDDRAFPGDELLLTLRISNPKLLPLPWLEVEDRVPEALEPAPADGDGEAKDAKGRVSLAGSLGWHERIGWRYRLRCRRRGVYPLGPATISSGDPFGFFPRTAGAGESERLVVYPRLIPLERLGLPPGFPMGERKAERWIFEDPSRMAGVRDYRPEDPFHRIHWKATARRQQLQVKVHEPTTTLETALFIGVETFLPDPGARGEGDVGENGEAFELAVSAVASLANRLIGQRHPVGLYLNGGSEGSRGAIEVPPGASQEQLIRILETLAGVEPSTCDALERMLDRVVPRLPWGSSAIVAVGGLPESLLGSLQGLVEMGHHPVVLLAGEEPAPEGLRGMTIHRLISNPVEV